MHTETKKIGIIGKGGRGLKNLGTKIVEKSGMYNMVVAGIYDKYKVQLDVAESHLLAQNKKFGIKTPLTKYSVYSPENDIMDLAIVNVEYENGVKAQLFLNIAAPRTEDSETLEIAGTDGRLRLDRHSAALDIVYNNGQEKMVVDAKDENHFKSGSHHGADYRLVKELADFAHGTMESQVTVEEGYLATRMSILATRSAKTHKTYKL